MPLFRLANKRIVVIDDNPSNLAVITTVLQLEGAKTTLERWGLTTIARLNAFKPIDLILLDLMFPHGVSGFDIFDEIRAKPDYATVPICAVSAMDIAVALPRVRAKGFNGLITKPIDIDHFPILLEKLINGESVWPLQYLPH